MAFPGPLPQTCDIYAGADWGAGSVIAGAVPCRFVPGVPASATGVDLVPAPVGFVAINNLLDPLLDGWTEGVGWVLAPSATFLVVHFEDFQRDYWVALVQPAFAGLPSAHLRLYVVPVSEGLRLLYAGLL